ncbi:unnamed protein product [Dovyalis caffra]|uniref:Transcription factor n=1 Tax=Dovyalis caffra TaxID=77055 RepID=A0AAV1SGK3_9ROSI|nr:unnamed protein product [Dovyalis caffra]
MSKTEGSGMKECQKASHTQPEKKEESFRLVSSQWWWYWRCGEIYKMMSNSKSNNNRVVMKSGKAAGPKEINQGLKKGPWTSAEDAILIEYVKKHGEGNWNSVQKNSGLMRCGKSCRLRWANHLRPNLKKGSFTPDEERIIIELHAKHGNKWAQMASQLPGRTDNEIKNYWNTRMKRRQRARLPIYPQDFQTEAAAFHFHHQEKDRRTQPKSSSTSLSSLLPSSLRNLSFSLLDPVNNFSIPLNPFQNHPNPLAFYSNPSHQLKLLVNANTNDGSLPVPSPSPVSLYEQSSPSTNLFNQNHTRQENPLNTPPSLFCNDADMESNMSFTSLMMGAQVQPIDFIPSELSSYQTPPGRTTSCGGACVAEASDKTNVNEYSHSETGQQGIGGDWNNSGLLDALLQEAKTISFKRKSNCEDLMLASYEGKRVMDRTIEEEGVEEDDTKRVKLLLRNGSEKLSDDLSSCQSSNIGNKLVPGETMENSIVLMLLHYSVMNPIEEAVDQEMNSMDDDLISLLNNFPSSEPLPEWYRQSRNDQSYSKRLSYCGINGDNRDLLDIQKDTSSLMA